MSRILKLSLPYVGPESVDISQFGNFGLEPFKGWKIEVNTDLEEADAWFVLDDLYFSEESCKVPANRVMLGNSETAHKPFHYNKHNYRGSFAEQFASIYTCFNLLNSKFKESPPFLPWMIHANHGSSIFDRGSIDFNFLSQLDLPVKNSDISVFCSDKSFFPGHKERLEFVNLMKDEFGDQLAWFGNGVNSIPRKLEGLQSFKYTVVLENQSRKNIITEKIGDAFLAYTYPFYWGAPNIDSFFNPKGFTSIDISKPKLVFEIIRESVASDIWKDRLPFIVENRRKVLVDFNFISRMINLVESIGPGESRRVTLRNQRAFFSNQEKIIIRSKQFLLNFRDKLLLW